jgi:hypothetical protein
MNELMDRPRRSKLIFAASTGSADRIGIDQLRRVREPVSRSKSTTTSHPAGSPSGAITASGSPQAAMSGPSF